MIGQTANLGAVVVAADGSLISMVTVTWSSLSPEVAAVEEDSGKVTAVAPGTAIIIASAGPATGRATILVTQESAVGSMAGVPVDRAISQNRSR